MDKELRQLLANAESLANMLIDKMYQLHQCSAAGAEVKSLVVGQLQSVRNVANGIETIRRAAGVYPKEMKV